MSRTLVCVGEFGVCTDDSRPGTEEAAFDIQVVYVPDVLLLDICIYHSYRF